MSLKSDTCPGEIELEAYARDGGDRHVARHVAACSACRRRVGMAQDDDEFLREFAVVLDGKHRAPHPAIPGYRVIEEIHRGGQGVVYKALQESTRRWVAIKMLLGGSVATARQQHRFEREIELIAALDHPHIVTVYESGVADGQPYFAMEYVRGTPLRIAKAPPAPAQVKRHLDLFKSVVAALAYAHQRAIIHRDLKPANVLIDSLGRPRIVDFGLARVLAAPQAAATQATRTGEFVGTFAYCAPEQLEGAPERVDTRTDVYSLGVILFEMLTGASPQPVSGPLDQVFTNIREHAPPPPSQLNPTVDDELETIVLTCLAKDPDRRYRSAGELLADLENYEAGRAILAKRDSAWYLLRKTAKRHRGIFIGGALAALLLIAFSFTVSVMLKRARHAESLAVAHSVELRAALRHSTIQQARLTDNAVLSEQLLWEAQLQGAPPPDARTAPTGGAYWGLWEHYRRYPCISTIKAGSGDLLALGTSRGDSTELHALFDDGVLRTWSIGDASEPHLWRTGRSPASAATHSNGWMFIVTDAQALEMWDLNSRALVARVGLSFTPSGGPFVSPQADQVGLIGPDCELFIWLPHEQTATRRALPPDATRVALGLSDEWYAASNDGVLYKLDRAGLVETRETQIRHGRLALSPNGRWLAITRRKIGVFATANLSDVLAPSVLTHVTAAGFSADSQHLLCGTRGASLRSWQLDGHAPSRECRGHAEAITAITADPAGKWFATGDQEGVVKVWSFARHGDVTWMPTEGFSNHTVAFSPDGRTLATTGAAISGGLTGPSPVRLWDVSKRSLRSQLTGHTGIVSGVAFAPHGRTLTTCDYNGVIRLWDARTGRQLDQRQAFPESGSRLSAIVHHPHDEVVVAAADNGRIAVWRPDSSLMETHKAHANRIPSLAFHPGGRWLVSASKDHRAIVWDTRTWTQRRVLEHAAPLRVAAFSPDGRYLATAGDDAQVTVWDGVTFDRLRTLSGHRQHVFALSFNSEGTLLVSGALDGGLMLWAVETGQNLAKMLAERRGDHVMSVAFGPDDHLLATAHTRERIGLWNLRHYERHMACNVEFQLERLGWDATNSGLADQWREWARARSPSLAVD